MKPTDALAVLDRAASLARMTRQEHADTLLALETLAPLVAPKPADDNKNVATD